MGVNFSKKEFAPRGANFFLEELTPFGTASLSREANRKLRKSLPFVKNVGKTWKYVHINSLTHSWFSCKDLNF